MSPPATTNRAVTPGAGLSGRTTPLTTMIRSSSSISPQPWALSIASWITSGTHRLVVTASGRDRIAELSKYAQSKGVHLMLWYNSNGFWNDAPQGPRNCMNTAIAREREMKWMQSIGIKGIKVDFFGGDKQETMQLYEDILSDANRYGLQVIFHGCTIPRGWERMYPNYVASEAVLASENVFFNEGAAIKEPFDLTLHPFCRNTTAAMDWGGIIMNKFLSKENCLSSNSTSCVISPPLGKRRASWMAIQANT